MCGIIGMAGDITFQHRQVFRDLLDVCQVRGRDSTGVVKVMKDLGDYDWVKQVGAPAFLCDGKEYDRLMTGDCAALIGHTRSKTSGEVSRRNAHPFDYPKEGICGVHNGTLRAYTGLDGYTYQKVDSDVLYGHLAQNGPQDTFQKLRGAWACVWWDQNEKTLNFIRNNERPLWFTWTEDMRVMIWASEIWMFSAVNRKIKLWPGEEGKSPFYELPVNQLWRFTPAPFAKKDEPTMKMKPSITIEPVEDKVVHRSWSRDSNGTWTGGEVPDPFRPDPPLLLVDLAEAGKWEELEEELDRAIGRDRDKSPVTPTDTAAEETNSHISNVAFLKNSVKGSGCSTVSNITRPSNRTVLSLPEKGSVSSQSSSSGEPSGPTGQLSARLRSLNGVSFRTVSGIDYITDNVTHQEWSEVEFCHNTGGKCTFCKSAVKNIKEVSAVLRKDAFICKSCFKEPTRIAG